MNVIIQNGDLIADFKEGKIKTILNLTNCQNKPNKFSSELIAKYPTFSEKFNNSVFCSYNLFKIENQKIFNIFNHYYDELPSDKDVDGYFQDNIETRISCFEHVLEYIHLNFSLESLETIGIVADATWLGESSFEQVVDLLKDFNSNAKIIIYENNIE